MEAGGPGGDGFGAKNGGFWSVNGRACISEIRAQSRRPIRTQSWVRRRSAMLMASQMPIAVSAIVNASAAILASMR